MNTIRQSRKKILAASLAAVVASSLAAAPAFADPPHRDPSAFDNHGLAPIVENHFQSSTRDLNAGLAVPDANGSGVRLSIADNGEMHKNMFWLDYSGVDSLRYHPDSKFWSKITSDEGLPVKFNLSPKLAITMTLRVKSSLPDTDANYIQGKTDDLVSSIAVSNGRERETDRDIYSAFGTEDNYVKREDSDGIKNARRNINFNDVVGLQYIGSNAKPENEGLTDVPTTYRGWDYERSVTANDITVIQDGKKIDYEAIALESEQLSNRDLNEGAYYEFDNDVVAYKYTRLIKNSTNPEFKQTKQECDVNNGGRYYEHSKLECQGSQDSNGRPSNLMMMGRNSKNVTMKFLGFKANAGTLGLLLPTPTGTVTVFHQGIPKKSQNTFDLRVQATPNDEGKVNYTNGLTQQVNANAVSNPGENVVWTSQPKGEAHPGYTPTWVCQAYQKTDVVAESLEFQKGYKEIPLNDLNPQPLGEYGSKLEIPFDKNWAFVNCDVTWIGKTVNVVFEQPETPSNMKADSKVRVPVDGTVSDGEGVTPKVVPTDSAHKVFKGWALKEDPTTVVDPDSMHFKKNTTFVPVFEDRVVVTFKHPDVDTNMDEDTSGNIPAGAQYTDEVPTPKPTDSHTVFKGWAKESDPNTVVDPSTLTYDEDTTFVPVFENHVDVTFNPGDNGSWTDGDTPENSTQTVNEGSAITNGVPEVTPGEGYTFGGFKDTETSTIYSPDEIKKLTFDKNTSFEAVYTPIEIDKPATPETNDPCGNDNITWGATPEDSDKFSWELKDGKYVATAKGGYVFAGGDKTVEYPLPADSGKACPVVTVTFKSSESGTISSNYAKHTFPKGGTYEDAIPHLTPNLGYTCNGKFVDEDGKIWVNEDIDGKVFNTDKTFTAVCDPIKIPKPRMPRIVDPCGDNNIMWDENHKPASFKDNTFVNGSGVIEEGPLLSNPVKWELKDGKYIATTVGGFVFKDGSKTATYSLPEDSGKQCPVSVTFNPGDNSSFNDGANTKETVEHNTALTGKVPTPVSNPGYQCEGFTKAGDKKVYSNDDIAKMTFTENTVFTAHCTAVEIDKPAMPETNDPCGNDNITWGTAPKDSDKFSWQLKDGKYIATAKDGYVFAGGDKTVTFALPKDNGKQCPVTVTFKPGEFGSFTAEGSAETPENTSQTFTGGQKLPKDSPVATPKLGYNCDGSYADADGKVYTPEQLKDMTFDKDTTFTAVCKPISIDKPVSPAVDDPCGDNNITWDKTKKPADTEQYKWTLKGNVYTATALGGYVFKDGEKTATYQLPADNKVACPAVKVSFNNGDNGTFEPDTSADRVNQTIGVKSPLSKDVPVITPGLGFTFDGYRNEADGKVYSATDIAKMTFDKDTTFTAVYSHIKVDAPATPEVKDPCGSDNITWVKPKDAKEYTWSLDEGKYVAVTTGGYVFTNGEKAVSFTLPADSGKQCATAPQPKDDNNVVTKKPIMAHTGAMAGTVAAIAAVLALLGAGLVLISRKRNS